MQELKFIGGLSVITGFVEGQTSVTLEPYKVELEVNTKHFKTVHFKR